MNWTLKGVSKETEHRFLNFYVYHYEVEKDGTRSDYPYFVATRREDGQLEALTKKGRADGVLVCALTDEKEPSILLIDVFRPPLNDYVVEFPAGLCAPEDVTPLETARRETIEETGFTLRDVKLLCPPSPTTSGLTDELVAVVEGKVDAKCARALEEYEDIDYRFVKLSEVRSYFETCGRPVALNVRLAVEILLERYRGK